MVVGNPLFDEVAKFYSFRDDFLGFCLTCDVRLRVIDLVAFSAARVEVIDQVSCRRSSGAAAFLMIAAASNQVIGPGAHCFL